MKARGNGIVRVTAYKHLVQGDLDYHNTQINAKITTTCNFGAAYDKYLWDAILLGLRNQKIYEKCIEVGDKASLCKFHPLAIQVYKSDQKLSIMQSLSYATAAANAHHNPSVSTLHVVKAKHKKGLTTEDEVQDIRVKVKPCYCCGAIPSCPMKGCPATDAECYKCGKEGHLKSSYNFMKGEKDTGKLEDM